MVAEFFAPTPTLAKKAAKVVFPKVAGELANQIPVAEVAKAVEEIAKTYRCVKAEYLVDSMKVIAPVADKFVVALGETLSLAMETHSKQFDKISNFILSYPDTTLEKKVELYLKLREEETKQTNERMKMVINATLGGAAVLTAKEVATNPKVNKTVQVLIKNATKTVQNYWKHAEKMVKLAK